MRKNLEALLEGALKEAREKGLISCPDIPIEIEKPRQEGHGDLATNLAMILAGKEKKPPREIAGTIIDCLGDSNGFLEKVEIAGPGFINFTISDKVWRKVTLDVLNKGEAYGRSDLGQPVESGTYYIRMQTVGKEVTRRVVVVR